MSRSALYISTLLTEKTAEHRFHQECEQNSAHIIKKIWAFPDQKCQEGPYTIYIQTFLTEKTQISSKMYRT